MKLCEIETGKVLGPIFHVDRLKLGKLKEPPDKPSLQNAATEPATVVAETGTVESPAVQPAGEGADSPESEGDNVPADEMISDGVILAQKGQGASLRFRVRPEVQADGSKETPFWVRADLVDSKLVDKFYKTHTKMGKIRKRKI